MSGLQTVLLLLVALIVYVLPSIVGWNKRNAAAIIALNLFFGWTGIGWVIAFIWAFIVDKNDK